MAEPKKKSSGAATKRKILEATLECLRVNGIVGTSARAIAGIGDFNQALIFYHFGSVNDAVIQAVGLMTEHQRDRYRSRLAEAEDLAGIVEIARDLRAEDARTGSISMLTQAFAGAQGNPEQGKQLYAQLEEWTEVVAEGIDRSIGGSPAASMVSSEHLAFGLSALFVGMELLTAMDPERAPTDELLKEFGDLANMLQTLLASPLIQSLADSSTKKT